MMSDYNDFLVKNIENWTDVIVRINDGLKSWIRRVTENEENLMKFMFVNILLYIWAWLLFGSFTLCAYLFFIAIYIGSQVIAFEPPKHENALSEYELKLTSIHEAGHTIVCWTLKMEIKLVTTKPDGNTSGRVVVLQDNLLAFESEIKKRIIMFFGGMIAEEIIFGEHTQGCSQDIKEAIYLARNYLEKYAMGEYLVYKNQEELNIATNKLLCECKNEAKTILNNNKELLLALSKELKTKRELKGKKVVDFLEQNKPTY